MTWLTGTTQMLGLDEDGDVTARAYDYRTRVVAVTRRPTPAVALTTATLFDAFNRAVAGADPYGRRTFQVFDRNDRLIRTVQELVPGGYAGTTSQAALAALARPTTTNPPFVITDQLPDAEGEILTRTDGRGIISRVAYDAQGRLVEQVEADRMPAGTSTVPSPDAARIVFVYDRQGNRTAEILPRSFARAADGSWIAGPDGVFRTSMGYTGRNLLAQRITGDGPDAGGGTRPERAVTAMIYTPTGKVATRSDPRGDVTTFTYEDCCDRLVQQTDPEGGTTRYAYDPVGNVTLFTDGNGNATATTYDAGSGPRRSPMPSMRRPHTSTMNTARMAAAWMRSFPPPSPAAGWAWAPTARRWR